MLHEEIDWNSGRVVFWDMSFLDPRRPLGDQAADLKEDLAQIQYPEGILLDIGWYPSFSSEGHFIVTVVRDSDWDEPLFAEKQGTLHELMQSLQRAIIVAAEAAKAE